ncbi:hypothetical protein V6N13_037730 [Hibiscus sabdariffa]
MEGNVSAQNWSSIMETHGKQVMTIDGVDKVRGRGKAVASSLPVKCYTNDMRTSNVLMGRAVRKLHPLLSSLVHEQTHVADVSTKELVIIDRVAREATLPRA